MEHASPLRAGLCGRVVTRFGPLLGADGVTFRLWAPAAREVRLLLDKPHAMRRSGDWFACEISDARAGMRYRFNIDNDIDIPDPASHFQPDDVHEPSEVIDHGGYQ